MKHVIPNSLIMTRISFSGMALCLIGFLVIQYLK